MDDDDDRPAQRKVVASLIILPVQAPFDKPYHEEYVAFNLIF
ncbi:hypothetical protein T4B_14927 [Trichinella pseudospiralis]|uniref:Uncharacterized protein n=1 Tax=Trichinella pseudospiralis TaxID=6337 RepID=A0A0V1G995_TRIPS|nr:hypothetical protein T4B_14927 [Trichinella pseudospiralis]